MQTGLARGITLLPSRGRVGSPVNGGKTVGGNCFTCANALRKNVLGEMSIVAIWLRVTIVLLRHRYEIDTDNRASHRRREAQPDRTWSYWWKIRYRVGPLLPALAHPPVLRDPTLHWLSLPSMNAKTGQSEQADGYFHRNRLRVKKYV